MAGFNKLLKRKGGVDEINDDFSDFSLSSPATKIRRLDCGLPPIVEEDETLTVAPPPAPANEERALVLFKPIHHHSPSSFSLSVNPDLISQFNKSNQFAWSKQCDYDRLIGSRDDEEEEQDNNNNRGLAIVPWVPKVQHQQPSPPSSSSQFDDFDDNNNAELMEADEIEEGMMMDVEPEQQQQQENTATATSTFQLPMPMAEGFQQQQQQQHCLLPHLPQNTSTPITWTWTR